MYVGRFGVHFGGLDGRDTSSSPLFNPQRQSVAGDSPPGGFYAPNMSDFSQPGAYFYAHQRGVAGMYFGDVLI